jgi:hypothetical protein
MTKKQQTILLASIGIFVVLVIAVVGVAIWAFTSMVENTDADEASATKTIDDVRARFAHATPLLDLAPSGLTLARRPPDTPPSGELKTLHVLVWNTDEEKLTRVEIPFWLLRLRDSPIDVTYQRESNDSGLKVKKTASSVRISDIERFGSALIVDGDTPDGNHVLIWSD